MTDDDRDADWESLRREFENLGAFALMMAKSPEEKRAAAHARDQLRNFREKNSLGRIVIDDVPHDALIRVVLESGLCARPIGRSLTFKEAREAFETWVREMVAGVPRVGMQSLISKLPSDFVHGTENRDDESASPQTRNRTDRARTNVEE